MFVTVTIIVVAGLITGNPLVIVVAGLIVAAVIAIGALYLFRSSGKKKRANSAAQGANGAADWQRQAQQQQGAPAAWNQQPMGMPPDNSWQQQQQAAPGAWNPQDNPWAQPAQQQQGASPAWNQQAMGMDNPWGQPAQQQPGWNAPAQQPATAWDMQGPAQQQAGGWAAPNSSQQAGGWGTPNSAQQQANTWAAPNPAPQQAGSWGNQGAQAAGMGGQQGWDSAPAAGTQDPWGQSQAQQQSASPWNAQSGTSASGQQAQTAFGGVGSAQPWSQNAQPAQTADPWAQPAAPAQQAAWPQSFQQGTPPPSPTTGNVGWQQAPNQGYGQGQQGYPAPGMFPQDEGDKTVLRSNTGPQGRVGIVRIEEGKEPGRVYEVRKDSLSIGRSRESDIFLEDLAVSRLHASIVSIGNGNYALRDEGSANGTKVNGQTVNKYQPYPLQEGDKIQLGQTVLIFAKR
jgi:FHA domain